MKEVVDVAQKYAKRCDRSKISSAARWRRPVQPQLVSVGNTS